MAGVLILFKNFITVDFQGVQLVNSIIQGINVIALIQRYYLL